MWSITDMDRTLSFYLNGLGFGENWRPERVGRGLAFVSLDDGLMEPLRAELADRGIAGTEGSWGYRCFIVADPDGNQLYFPYPADEKGGD